MVWAAQMPLLLFQRVLLLEYVEVQRLTLGISVSLQCLVFLVQALQETLDV